VESLQLTDRILPTDNGTMDQPNPEPIVRIRDLYKIFTHGGENVVALDGIALDIYPGDFVAIMGPSGAGKSTLLNILAGIDRPTRGECTVLGEDITQFSENDFSRWRNAHVGFIFQSFNLIPVLTAAENVEMPLLLTSLSRAERREHVEVALGIVRIRPNVHAEEVGLGIDHLLYVRCLDVVGVGRHGAEVGDGGRLHAILGDSGGINLGALRAGGRGGGNGCCRLGLLLGAAATGEEGHSEGQGEQGAHPLVHDETSFGSRKESLNRQRIL
jgi:hypothetical protein